MNIEQNQEDIINNLKAVSPIEGNVATLNEEIMEVILIIKKK